MLPLLRSCAISMLVAATLGAQTKSVAERLGYPANTKLLILHADDLGVAHSVDSASFDALDRGAITSASIMIPTPWVTEVAAYARAHPNADLGLHLTLTSEWETYRWGPISPVDKVPSLLDRDGTLPRETETVVARANLLEIERELRAQVDRAIALGIHPTHLDSHMGALFTTPALLAVYVKVAHSYGLPFLGTRNAARTVTGPLLSDQDILPDAVITAGAQVPRDKWAAFYLDAIANLQPGLTEMIVHLGYDDAELRAVTIGHEPWGAAWRQRDYDVVTSAEFKRALRDNHVVLVTWRDLKKVM